MELVEVVCVLACTLGAGSMAMSFALWARTNCIMRDMLLIIKNPQKARRELIKDNRYKNL